MVAIREEPSAQQSPYEGLTPAQTVELLLSYANRQLSGDLELQAMHRAIARILKSFLTGQENTAEEELDALFNSSTISRAFAFRIIQEEAMMRYVQALGHPEPQLPIEIGLATSNRARITARVETGRPKSAQEIIVEFLGEEGAKAILEKLAASTSVRIDTDQRAVTIFTETEVTIVNRRGAMTRKLNKALRSTPEIVSVQTINREQFKTNPAQKISSFPPTHVLIKEGKGFEGAIFLPRITTSIPEGFEQYRLPSFEQLKEAISRDEALGVRFESLTLTDRGTHAELTLKREKPFEELSPSAVIEILSGIKD